LLALGAICVSLIALAQADGGASSACASPAEPGCLDLATRLLTGASGPRDPARAADLYAQACGAGNGEGCFRLAGLFESGTGTLVSFSQALVFLRKGCELRSAAACTEAGALLAEGVGAGDAGSGDASKLFEQGCSLGNGLACLRLAGSVELSGARGKAADLYERACSQGERSGCNNFLALALSVLGPVKAGPLLKQETTACEQDDSLACWFVADLYRDGIGVQRDFSNAAAYYQRACEAEEPLACTSLGDLYLTGRGVPADRKRAAALFRTACQEGDNEACSRKTAGPRKH
jgi:TPR repeat protein